MNVNLWFAKDVDSNEIISVVNSNKENEYKCPICNSDVIPKAIESKRITPHFAHIDKSKCSSESFIHFWMKHQFIEVGENFTIEADKRIEYVCKSFKTEVRYELDSGVYIPDIVVETECGNEIVFEMANTNKKQVKDYIDKWIELDKIIVEVDIKGMVSESREFKALYYKGKCFNFNKRDGGYYNTIGKLKEDMKQSGKYDIEAVRKLDWFWDELVRYKSNENINEQEIFKLLNLIDEDSFKTVNAILYRNKCTDIMYRYLEDRLCKFKEKLIIEVKRKLNLEIDERIKTQIEYCRMSNSYNSYIGIYHYKDKCWWLNSDFSKNGVKRIINDIREDEFYRQEKLKKDEINAFQESIVNKIKNNNKIKQFINELKEGYELSIFSKRRGQYDDFFDGIKIGFGLTYNRASVFWDDIEECKDSFDIESLISDRIAKVKFHLKKIDTINNSTINEIVNLINTIQRDYSEYNLRIEQGLFLEDVYTFYIEKDRLRIFLYFNNLGLLQNCRTNDLIAELRDSNKLHSSVFNIIDKEIENYFSFNCKECHEETILNKNEISFFLKRNLNIPKRCKTCRNKRKTEVVK